MNFNRATAPITSMCSSGATTKSTRYDSGQTVLMFAYSSINRAGQQFARVARSAITSHASRQDGRQGQEGWQVACNHADTS